MSHEIAVRPDLLALIRERDEIVAQMLEILRLTRELEERKARATPPKGLPHDWFCMNVRLGTDGKRAIAEIDHDFWMRAMQLTNLYLVMSAAERDKFERQLNTKVPPFDVETVYHTIMVNLARSGDMLLDGLYGVWQALKHTFKSHDGVGFGPRMVFKHSNDCWRFERRSYSTLYDLDKTIAILTRTEFYNSWFGCRLNVLITRTYEDASRTAEDGLYRVKTYKNGNVHIYIKDADVLELLNRTLAQAQSRALPHHFR